LNCSSEKYMLQVNCSRNVCSLNLDYNIFWHANLVIWFTSELSESDTWICLYRWHW
jgi:hypothetical protein